MILSEIPSAELFDCWHHIYDSPTLMCKRVNMLLTPFHFCCPRKAFPCTSCFILFSLNHTPLSTSGINSESWRFRWNPHQKNVWRDSRPCYGQAHVVNWEKSLWLWSWEKNDKHMDTDTARRMSRVRDTKYKLRAMVLFTQNDNSFIIFQPHVIPNLYDDFFLLQNTKEYISRYILLCILCWGELSC